jgi:Fe2+ transport system protein FeoA
VLILLTPKQQRTIRALLDSATDVVAEAEGVTIEAIHMRRYRARKRLQRLGLIPSSSFATAGAAPESAPAIL